MTDDPGWKEARRGAAWVVLPSLAAKRAAAADVRLLVALRTVFMAFAAGLAGVTVVVAVLSLTAGFESSVPTLPAAAVVALVGLAGIAAERMASKPLDCTSDESLAAGYRARFFVRMALAEAAALAGFVAFVLTASPVPYAVGLAFAVLGFARAAPSAAHVESDEQALAASGCGRSLRTALS